MASVAFGMRFLRLAAICALSAGPALAEPVSIVQSLPHASDQPPTVWSEEGGAINIVVAADRLRGASQQISALACHSLHDVAPEASRAQLRQVVPGVTQAIDALDRTRFGPAKLGADLRAMEGLWGPVRGAIATLSKTPEDPTAHSLLTAGGDVLKNLSEDLSGSLRDSFAAQTATERRILVALDVLGQQAALSQAISKTACEIWAGDRSNDTLKDFAASTWMLTEALSALRHGRPSMGLEPAPSHIRIALDGMAMDWRSAKTYVDGMMEEDIPLPAKRLIFDRLNSMTAKFGQIMQLYAAQPSAHF